MGQTGRVIAIVSQAWTADAGEAADRYRAGIEEFGDFHRGQPGFRGRVLLRSDSDTTHFTNIRFFDRVEDYEAMIHRPGYAERIEALAAHLRPHEGAPGKDVAEVVVHDWPLDDGLPHGHDGEDAHDAHDGRSGRDDGRP
jgi:hypothetical protein